MLNRSSSINYCIPSSKHLLTLHNIVLNKKLVASYINNESWVITTIIKTQCKCMMYNTAVWHINNSQRKWIGYDICKFEI